MLDHNTALLARRTGRDVTWWLAAARAENLPSARATRGWLADHGVTGYAQNPVMWELYGYPDYFLKDAAQLLEGQYADRPQLRPIADAVIELVLGWADDGRGAVDISLRKTYVSLHTPRRKFAQVTPGTKTAVDIFLRLDEPARGRLEAVKTRAQDPFTRKIRLRGPAELDAEAAGILLRAYRANT
ncbi:DUF5655 domain-containing protein [Specibacter sp. RAF43]|uniref:DUF5655 domain-containing protein n=1 Tax=Specibacter sp. RAF43 TaxID=3233057 RepID=UPI003F9E8587